MKYKFRFKSRGIIRVVAFAMALPIIYTAASVSMPLMQPFIENMAVFSASISFAPKSKNALNGNFNSRDDFIEENYIDIADNEVNIEYEETSAQEQTIQSPISEQTDAPAQNETANPANTGNIVRRTYLQVDTSVYINLNEGYIKNCTKLSPQKILDGIKSKSKIKIKGDTKPEVLIMHTHATESYQETELDYFDKASTARTTDNTKNTTRIGDEIERQLKEAGIGVIHDRTLHDYPSYNGAYERSAVTVKNILKNNPTIKVVLDVHRDAIQPNADTMIAPVTTVNGKKCAQVMIISGCDDGTMGMPKYMENLKLSVALQRQMEKDYKTLARPILFDYRKYNQNLTTGSILLEMGGHANTLEETIYCGELVGKSLAKTLLSLK